MAVFDAGQVPSHDASRTGLIVNYAGAALSLTLMAGIGVWGYQLIMRDVSGIPVVRAMEGEMRVLPENPGGDVALHTGLAVNAVAAVGEAAAPEDRLVLAPATQGLAQEDLDVQTSAEANEVLPTDPVTEHAQQTAVSLDASAITDTTAQALSTDEILALADQIAAAAPALETPLEASVIPASVPGVARSRRPALRPASLQTVAATVPAPVTANVDEVAVTTAAFATGTHLVQLGAFPSPDVAAGEWTRLNTRFKELMDGKERVIQVATRNGNTFYRLRSTGFNERSDARRFCAALIAEGADCIPVVVK